MYVRLFVTASMLLLLSVYVTTIQASDSERVDTAVREARQVASEGPFLPQWESLEKYEIPAVVQRREVRNLHPLGRLLRAGLHERMVPADDVHRPRHLARQRIQTSRGDVRSAQAVWLQGLHSPA